MGQRMDSMIEFDEGYYAILEVLNERTSTPLWIRQSGGFDQKHETKNASKQEVHERLDALTNYGYVVKVTRGLYEITDKGERKLEERDDD